MFWLNTEDFLQHPLHKVSALVATLDSRRLDSDDATTGDEATTVLLGPPSSGVLKAMFDEEPTKMPPVVEGFLKKVAQFRARPNPPPSPLSLQVSRRVGHGHAADRSALGPGVSFQAWIGEWNFKSLESSARKARKALRVFSHQATIPVNWLACRPDDAGCPAEKSSLSQPPGVESFHSAITDDGQVLEAVLKELANRGACKGRERPTVVIMSEQDTVYGRLLGDLAEHAAKQVGSGAGCEIQIVQHGYLRGVDGEMPPPSRPSSVRTIGRDEDRLNEPAQEDSPATRGERTVRSLPGNGFEQPFGAARLDYVRRLSERLPRDGSDEAPVAIGVLGNDVYDKLLVLQALRDSHPGVLFFTTDMDARLLDPAVNQWTRNLIVGSAYGLSPPESASGTFRDSYQVANTFRDSYQVALFVAVQEALDRRHRISHEPKLFEISRTGFVPLGSQASNRNGREVAVLLTPLAALAIFALVMYGRQREETARIRRQLYGFVAILASVAAAWLYTLVRRLPNKEPGSLFDGVSTVPMIMLQITTIVFAVAIICFAHGRMRHTLSYVAGRLGKTAPDHGLRAMYADVKKWWSGGEGSLLQWADSLVSTLNHDIGNDKGNKKTADNLWEDVLCYSGWWPRFVRIGVGLLIGLALRDVYFSSVRTQQPLLGQAETTPGWMTHVLPVVLFWAISYCRDTVRVWQKFIRALSRFNVTGGRDEQGRNTTWGSSVEKKAIHARWLMDLLVSCTNVIGPVVVMPLILMVLLMLARSTLFDGWNWTIPLVVFHVGLSVYVLFIAVAFQREASNARTAVLDRLQEAKLDAKSAYSSTKIEAVMKYIQSRRDGAFVPWTQHPILQTLTLPLGSVALITILERWLGRLGQ